MTWPDRKNINSMALVTRVLSRHPSPATTQKNPKGVGNCLGNFFWISGSHHFPCYLQHFGAGNCHFHGMCNGFEFEPLIFHCIFHGICNSLQHVLSIFHALCSIFELESAFPPYVQHFTATFLTVLAGFWS